MTTTEVRFHMPFSSRSRRVRATLLAGCALGLFSAAPAHAASSAANPLGCAPTQDLSTPLTSFADTSLYALAPGGTFEAGTTAGWTLQNASTVQDNEPFDVLGTNGTSSLRLAENATAISAPMCVDETFPNFRFFARNAGSAKSTLQVSVLFMDAKGKVQAVKSGSLTAGDSAWQLVNPMKIGITIDRTALNGAAPIAFQFSSIGKGGDWRVDDLLVDPYRRS